MFSRGLHLALGAAAAIGLGGPGPLSDPSREYRYRSPRRYTGVGMRSDDLTDRPTPPLAHQKPLTKRQKRRLRGKRQ